MNFRAQHHQGEQVTLTARIATSIRTSGGSQGDAIGSAVTPSVTRPSGGTGAPSSAWIRTRLVIAITAIAMTFLLALSATPALATTGHGFAGSFGGPGQENGQFNNTVGFPPFGVGVGLAGDVFVSDSVRIQRFDASGTFQSVIPIELYVAESGAVAVDSSPAGGVYVSGGNRGTNVPEVAKYNVAGVFQYDLDASLSETSINFGPVAVDPSNGTVYAMATNNNTFAPVIDSFSQTTGRFIASFNGESGSPDGGFACPSGLSVDPTHQVYVLDPCKGRVDKYSAAGAYEATVDNGSRGAPQAIATDPKTGEVYVAQAGPSGLQITSFIAGGTSVETTFPAANVGSLAALAVGPDGTVYAADRASAVVDRFTAFVGPTVTTAAASPVERTSATLNGTIDPEGIASKYHYEYGLQNTYGSSTADIDAGSGSSAVEAPGPVTGLVPNTTYHYRVVGSNASGSIFGEDQTLTTEAAPPTVDGSPAFASSITPTGARVHATVDPEHSPTTFHIEYGTSTAYGSIAPEGGAEVGEQSSDQAVATTLTGLQPGTLYHFRVSAEDGIEGPQTGADATFVTAPAAAATASEVTTRKATLSGTIDPHGAATTYHFNYGPSTAYGASTIETNGGSGNGEQAVSAHITGLSPSSTYHVQVVATTNGITRSGADGSFTTSPAPTATVSDPVAVTTSSATLQGAANTHGVAGSYHFEVTATEGSFTTHTAEQPLSAATGAQPVSTQVSGLPSGQSLKVRLIVSSNESSDVSDAASFATAPLPPEGFPAPPPPSSVYGCTAPKLNPFNGRPAPGSTIAITGSDLGLAGSVLLGEDTLVATNWSAGGFTIEVPTDAAGTLGLTINCGHASNTVAIATSAARAPSNTFRTGKATVKGSTATLKIRLPGPGKLQVSGAKTKATSVTVAKAGSQTVQLKLNSVGLKALRKAKRRTLTAKVQLRFTPTGGQPATQTATLTFERKGGH
jgi:hypothetical protein